MTNAQVTFEDDETRSPTSQQDDGDEDSEFTSGFISQQSALTNEDSPAPPSNCRRGFGAASVPVNDVQPSNFPLQDMMINMGLNASPSPMEPTKLISTQQQEDRVKLNIGASNVQRFYHIVTPRVIQHDGSRFALCSLKVPPSYSNHVEVKVRACGRQAEVTFTKPKVCENEIVLLGDVSNRSDMDIVYEAIRETIASQKEREETRITHKLVLDLPFHADPSTSTELLGLTKQGEETGQRSDLLPVKKIPDVFNYTCNVVFVFKELATNFRSVSSPALVSKNPLFVMKEDSNKQISRALKKSKREVRKLQFASAAEQLKSQKIAEQKLLSSNQPTNPHSVALLTKPSFSFAEGLKSTMNVVNKMTSLSAAAATAVAATKASSTFMDVENSNFDSTTLSGSKHTLDDDDLSVSMTESLYNDDDGEL